MNVYGLVYWILLSSGSHLVMFLISYRSLLVQTNSSMAGGFYLPLHLSFQYFSWPRYHGVHRVQSSSTSNVETKQLLGKVLRGPVSSHSGCLVIM